jgi:hypothetical protein
MDAAMAPWRMVLTGAVAGFFLVSFIVDSFRGLQFPSTYHGIREIVQGLGQDLCSRSDTLAQ